jgi:hypothetical protein
MSLGIRIIMLGNLYLSIMAGAYYALGLSAAVGVIGIICGHMVVMCGVCMATNNALSLALVRYKWCIGTASSIFGLGYYCVVSLVTFGMGVMHTGSVLIMPLYFVFLSGVMLLVARRL